jgi:hypothetical protein
LARGCWRAKVKVEVEVERDLASEEEEEERETLEDCLSGFFRLLDMVM